MARINLHKIFFESSVTDKMGYIAHTRLLREERAYKKPGTIQVNTAAVFAGMLQVTFFRRKQIGL